MKNIRVIVKSGKYPGKKILILGGVHGDEVCGVKAFNELLPNIEIEKGQVTFIYANLKAHEQNKRFVEANLNRCFLDNQPDELKNTLEGNTAKALIPYLKEADILLDLHSSKTSENQNFLICEEDCLDLANALSPNKIILGIDNFQKGGSDGYMFNKGKPGICIECGLHTSQESIKTAKKAILNLLKKVGAISGPSMKFNEKEIYRVQYMHMAKNGDFKLAEDFNDFQKVIEKTLIGFDGDKEIYIESNDVIMFPSKESKLGEECFVILGRVEK